MSPAPDLMVLNFWNEWEADPSICIFKKLELFVSPGKVWNHWPLLSVGMYSLGWISLVFPSRPCLPQEGGCIGSLGDKCSGQKCSFLLLALLVSAESIHISVNIPFLKFSTVSPLVGTLWSLAEPWMTLWQTWLKQLYELILLSCLTCSGNSIRTFPPVVRIKWDKYI